MKRMILVWLMCLIGLAGCYREPLLHLYDMEGPRLELPQVELRLDLYWGINWRTNWYYGSDAKGQMDWDDEDKRIFGELEYKEPTQFYLRRYYTGSTPLGHRIEKKSAFITGRSFRSTYDWGYWDILAWNEIETLNPNDGQSIRFNEPASYDEPVTAETGPSMYPARYHAPRYQNAFYQPEQLFSACQQGIEINENLKGFVFDEEEKVWVKTLEMPLEPITYIYLPQIILHNNDGSGQSRIKELASSSANLSGMARTTNVNTGIAGTDAVAVNFNMRMKYDKTFRKGEIVDIIGGRLMTFGICGQNANRVSRAEDSNDSQRHYIDVQVRFNNDMDSTIVFDVTDSIQKYYKGGVITMELDMKDVPAPKRPGGSGFNAIVKDFEDGGTWEFDM